MWVHKLVDAVNGPACAPFHEKNRTFQMILSDFSASFARTRQLPSEFLPPSLHLLAAAFWCCHAFNTGHSVAEWLSRVTKCVCFLSLGVSKE